MASPKVAFDTVREVAWYGNFHTESFRSKLLRSPSRSGSMRKLVGALSKIENPFPPLQPSKRPKPKLVQICPGNCFGGFQSGGLKFEKICQNLSKNYRFSNFDKFFQISVPLTGTPQNNCQDKFWTNLGFGRFSRPVRGKRELPSLRLFLT